MGEPTSLVRRVRELRADQLERRTSMGKVRTGLAVSLDGFISGPNDGADAPMGVGGERLLAWYAAGDTDYRLPGTDMVFQGLGPDRRVPPRDARNDRGVGVWSKDSTSPMAGVASTPWMCRSLLSAARSPKRGSTRDRRSPSSPTAWKAPSSKRKRSPATRMSAWAPRASCSSASERDSWTRSTSTWCPSCSGRRQLVRPPWHGPIDLERTRVIEGAGVTHLTFRVVK